MRITVRCPSGCLLSVPQKRLGTVFSCPSCHTAIDLPPGASLLEGKSVGEPIAMRIAAPTNAAGLPAAEADVTNVDQSDGSEEVAILSFDFSQLNSRPVSKQQLHQRIARSVADRILVGKFIAILIIVAGAINFVPAAYHWSLWSTDAGLGRLPRWIYLQIFVAALQVIYGVFALQIEDWSAMKSLSAVMLMIGAAYGFVAAALALGDLSSPVSRFLGLSVGVSDTARIWCVLMLLLSTPASYLCAREGLAWQQLDKLAVQAVDD